MFQHNQKYIDKHNTIIEETQAKFQELIIETINEDITIFDTEITQIKQKLIEHKLYTNDNVNEYVNKLEKNQEKELTEFFISADKQLQKTKDINYQTKYKILENKPSTSTPKKNTKRRKTRSISFSDENNKSHYKNKKLRINKSILKNNNTNDNDNSIISISSSESDSRQHKTNTSKLLNINSSNNSNHSNYSTKSNFHYHNNTNNKPTRRYATNNHDNKFYNNYPPKHSYPNNNSYNTNSHNFNRNEQNFRSNDQNFYPRSRNNQQESRNTYHSNSRPQSNYHQTPQKTRFRNQNLRNRY